MRNPARPSNSLCRWREEVPDERPCTYRLRCRRRSCDARVDALADRVDRFDGTNARDRQGIPRPLRSRERRLSGTRCAHARPERTRSPGRASTRGCVLPIIMITGYAEVPMAVRAMKAGAIDFIEKPFSAQDLLDRVRYAIDLSQQVRAEK